MATYVLRSTDVGAPTLSGTNGTLCTVLDWALVAIAGWAIEYTATNHRVYRAATGNRRRLYVGHDSAVSGDARLATVRGAENASAAAVASLTDAFPTTAQVANASSSVLCSTATGSTARAYKIIVTPTFVAMAINCGGTNQSNWELWGFGDLAGADSADVYATIMHIGNNAATTATSARGMSSCGTHVVSSWAFSACKVWLCRNIDGSQKSVSGGFVLPAGTTPTSFCSVSGAGDMRAGYGNRILREKVAVTCSGSNLASTVSAMNQYKRGWVPNLWNPVHTNIGSVSSDDSFGDTAYNASAVFEIVPATTAICAILEMSDTWSAPSG